MQYKGFHISSEPLKLGAGIVGTNPKQGRCALQLVFPVLDLRLELSFLQVSLLPECIIAVLNGEGWLFNGLLASMHLIIVDQVLSHYPHRPTIRKNVVEGKHQDMLPASAFHQDQPNQRPFLQIEFLLAFGLMQKLYFLLWVVQMTEIEIRYRELGIEGHLLHRLFPDHKETGPQHLMPTENAVDRLFKSRQR